ncbi:metallophosphoesterase [Flavobacterium sp. MFBS3-15]|uniref:metallophosphoesterase n=1 Tax=Flavobacterium sp. MFBS3-15 TaxID=2989816 RepID=UPI002235F4FE|nr:metallophosphoesterase [Flavobacterium sp. MFBS3-15]MCW4468666.1 metallophosphoesterase [Flavobacterium sp. MFBS3-15]
MRRALIYILIAAILGEVYTFLAVKTLVKTRWMLWAYVGVSVFIIAFIIWSFTQFDRSVGQTKRSLFTIGLMLITVIPKMVVGLILLGEDIFRVIGGFIRTFLGNEGQSFLPERRKFVSQIALGVAAIPFLSFLYGMKWGKYNFKVRKETIYFPDLPENFDGFTITQISDIHSGSFDNPEKIAYAIDLINEQHGDIVLFTGDIVNTHAEEMYNWIDTFKKIETPAFGKYSILGNHDYGEYVTWPSQREKNKNFEDIKGLHKQIDFKLLLNEHVKLEKGGQEIALVGVENWGVNFKQAGDLGKASKGLDKEDFKILMSHDPSHWEHEVKDHPNNYHLTLSGHTHGLQFGIEIPGVFKWSPVQYVYKQWAGLYENVGRYIYVNRGFGFHAYPGRVGIWPEITVIELKKGQKAA